jgi:hypothetical protein
VYGEVAGKELDLQLPLVVFSVWGMTKGSVSEYDFAPGNSQQTI